GVHRGNVGGRLGGRVLAQAEQNQVIRLDGMEGVFRMQVQFVIETVRGGAAGKRALWKEIVDDAAAGFLDIADRLAQQDGGLEQQSLTAIVLLVQFGA